MRLPKGLLGFVTALALTQNAAAQTPATASAAETAKVEGEISIELNKLEEKQGSCRLYLVIRNRTKTDLKNLELDVFIFDRKDIITRRVGLNTRRLKPVRTYIRLFDITKVTCPEIERLVLNEVISCTSNAGAAIECEDALALTSRSRVKFLD